MNVNKGFVTTIGIAALMVVVAACGNGVEPNSLSDEVQTPFPPTVGGTTPTDSNPPTTPIVSHDGPVKDYVILVDNLRAAGATVEEVTGPPTQYGFSVGGKRVVVNEGTIHVFEFPSTRDADSEASFISADGWIMSVPLEGGVIRETNYEWAGTPHFYKKGTLIVVYNSSQYSGLGDDKTVIDVLESVLGPQFAGGAVAQQPTPTSTPPPQVQPTVTEE